MISIWKETSKESTVITVVFSFSCSIRHYLNTNKDFSVKCFRLYGLIDHVDQSSS